MAGTTSRKPRCHQVQTERYDVAQSPGNRPRTIVLTVAGGPCKNQHRGMT